MVHSHFGSNSDRSGHVRVFQYAKGVNETWKQIEDIEGESRKDRLGWSFSLSGDNSILATGSKLHDAAREKSGAAWVYQYNNSTRDWDLFGKMVDQAKGDDLGHAVSLSNDGNIIAISSIDGTRSYVENNADEFGDSISISANSTQLAIGLPKNDEVTRNSGLVQ
eukprot:3773809-Ditylum_brightwellii.AAC.1